MSTTYISTRGNAPAVNAAEALLNGIAPDGGLYVPENLPAPGSFAEKLHGEGSFATTLGGLLALFFDAVPAAVRDAAVRRSLARFSAPEIVPLRSFGNTHFLELFHGPTFAFKDVALTLLPLLLQFSVKNAGLDRAAILTATSGDTGSAAMSGFAGVAGTEVLVFYPQSGTSEIQRRQMVCCAGDNVHACAIEGNFDDAQNGVKAAFADARLRAAAAEKRVFLSSANSINIGRLFPQISYYLDAWRRLAAAGALDRSGVFDVVVPTGNFGNILAANFAKKLGAPIRRLVAASNKNRVIADFIATGTYESRREFFVTNSPSMDILVSSNVERLLYELCGNDAARVRSLMISLKNDGAFTLATDELARLQENFACGSATPAETETAIAEIYRETGFLADPHTAVGWKVLKDLRSHNGDDGVPALIAATASPWKFPTTMLRALTGTCSADDFENLRALAAFTHEPPALAELEHAPILHTAHCARDGVSGAVRDIFRL